MAALTDPACVAMDVVATDRAEVSRLLVDLLAAAGRVTDADGFAREVQSREAQAATGFPGGIALPHGRSELVTTPSLAVALVPGGVDFGAPDGPATLVVLLAVPLAEEAGHLPLLSALARRVVHESFRDALRQAPDAAAVAEILNAEVVTTPL